MNQSTVDLVNQLVNQTSANLEAYKELQTLVTSGWQTDQTAIDQAKKDGYAQGQADQKAADIAALQPAPTETAPQ